MSEILGDDGIIAMIRKAAPHLARTNAATETSLTRLQGQHNALHSLVDRLLTAGDPLAVELAAILWPFWWLRGHMAEGRAFLERAARLTSATPDVYKGLGTIAFRQGDLDAARAAFDRRLALVQAAGDRRAIADAHADLARTALRRGDFAEVRDHADRGYAAAEGLEPDAVRMPLHMRAAAARMEGRYGEARALYLESRALNERLGNAVTVAAEDHNLMHVALHTADREEAERRYRASSAWIFDNDNAYLRPYAFLDAGILALHDGELDRAARLVAVARRIFEETGAIPDPDDRVELDDAARRIREELGDRYETLSAEGREFDLDDAIALARR